MTQNLISATFSATDAADVQQSLTNAKNKMPFLSTMQNSLVNTIFKPGNAYLPFIDQINHVVEIHPEILPAIFDLEEFKRDYQLFKTIYPIYNQIGELMEGVKKTYTAVGSDTLVGGLEVYAAMKQNKDKIPGLSVICDELAVFFKRTRIKTDSTEK